ncbi:MAG TPA: hypothetical protein DCZ95_18210 [Verrucomicrobia bacterium]|nr:hypothetical protein [Verrucomicrobiota bacterium]
MASITWPATLPQEMMTEGYSQSAADVAMRTEMGAGPAKVRRRYSAGPKPVKGKIFVTAAQLVTFKTFCTTTAIGGTLRFNWHDPDDGTTAAEMRFVSPPSWAPSDNEDNWEVNLDLEIMP